jgi:hypothetical protein
MAWLGTGDQLAPVVVASTGALSFAWTVLTSNTQTGVLARLRNAAENMRQRRHAGAVGIQGLTADIFRKPPLPGVDWLVFLDGVDEILQVSQRSVILSTLGSYLAERKSSMRLVITSRPLSTGELAELHAHDVGQMHLRPFDRDDIREFARNWFIARAEYSVPRDKIEESVDNFVNSVRHAGLEGMMRVPLLVAMAALIFEREEGSQLPTTRSGLYREYISLLLSARHSEITQAGAGANLESNSVASFGVWINQMLPGLLIALAVARVEDAGSSLMRIAREWVGQRLWADNPSEPEWPWLGLLQSTLIATSVLEAIGSDIEFPHQSIAEYLAADPKVRALDYRTLKSELADPARRSLGLFTLARSGEPIAPIVRGLLDSDDPLSAGYVLAEGFAVDEELRQKVQAAWGASSPMRSASRAALIRSSSGILGTTTPASSRESAGRRAAGAAWSVRDGAGPAPACGGR